MNIKKYIIRHWWLFPGFFRKKLVNYSVIQLFSYSVNFYATPYHVEFNFIYIIYNIYYIYKIVF